MRKMHYFKNFIKCGLCGWGFECFWTGLHSIIDGESKDLPCKTSIWMFPIYGMAAFIEPLYHVIKKRHIAIRGIIYTLCIFLAEFGTGYYLKKKNRCPWDYSEAKTNYKGIVRLDYAPLWFIVGLIYEKILLNDNKKTK